MTPSELFFKMIVLASEGTFQGNATVNSSVDIKEGVVKGSFAFPISMVQENGEISIATPNWLSADFSSLEIKGVE